jgi:hypothetical protein
LRCSISTTLAACPVVNIGQIAKQWLAEWVA